MYGARMSVGGRARRRVGRGGREGVSVRLGWPNGSTQGGGGVTGRAGEKEEGGEWAGVGQKGEEAHVAFLPFSLGF